MGITGSVGGAIVTRQSVKELLTSMLGTTTYAALGGITVGWLIGYVIWCVGKHYVIA